MKKLLLLLLLLPFAVSAQSFKKGNPCTTYSDSIQPLVLREEGSLVYYDEKKDTHFEIDFDWPVTSSLNLISNEVLVAKLKELAKCEINHFINSRSRGKKQREQLKQNYTVLDQKLFKTTDDLTIGIQKAVTGEAYKIYSNTLIIVDGETIHSFTDFSEVDFNITLSGAEKKATNYILIGEEEANQGSVYYGKFAIYFTPHSRTLAYEKRTNY